MQRFRPLLHSHTSRRSWILLLLVLAYPLATFAAETPGAQIDWLRLLMGLLGGLAMFLFGMEQMSDGLKGAAGDTLKDILARLTRNRFMGALTGAFARNLTVELDAGRIGSEHITVLEIEQTVD